MGVERRGAGGAEGGGETPAGPALRCRWAGPAAGPAALAALGSRPRRARRAGLGLRGGAGTGSGKRQCSGGGGGGALPLREPSAGRRAGAAVSRERGPRSPHGRRRGESRERPGAYLPRRDAPAAEPPRPHPGLGPRVPALLTSSREPAPRLRTAPRSCLPGSHSSPKPARCAPLAPAPAPRSLLRPTTRALPPHASDAAFCPGRTLGCAPGCAFRPAGGEWPTFPGHPGGPTGPAGGGRAALCSPGTGRAPRFPPHRGARPGNRQPPEPPGPGPETDTEPACVHTSLTKLSRPRRPGGGESGCARESATGR